jgi:hypothetical protein
LEYRKVTSLKAILELKHHFALLVVMKLNVAMIRITASAKSRVNIGHASCNATLVIELLVLRAKPILDRTQRHLAIQDTTAWMPHGNPVCNSRTNKN